MELTPDLQEKKIFLIEGLKRTYKGQYDAIQPLPYIKDRLYCVDKVFVEGGIEVCLAPELTRGTGGSWERLESYKSIYTDFRLNSKRRIIQGEPGYGKSTLTLQLAYDWCNDVSDSPMNNVEILILLRLRQLGSVKCLFRAIKSFLLFHEPRVSKHEIEKIICSCSSVHITLDGYDEYPGSGSDDNDYIHRIINMELFADFDVSLTTRYLPESLREETKRAKLTGFDDKARDEYIRKAVVGNNDEAVEEIKQRLYENFILADLCQVPLIFVMFSHMAHDQRDIMKFISVTQFFKHTIRCFYDHLKRKRKLYDDRNNMFYLHEMEHHELDKIAFEGLNKENQQLSWIKTEFRQRVGLASYDQYIITGILVEEDVVGDDSTGDNVLFTTEVRFYHKLFCEWYAAHHLVTLVKNAYYLSDMLRFLDPFDLQYLFRFACGLDPDAGKKLIIHLKSLPGGDAFAILCILEQTGDVNEIMDSVKDLCSRDVKIQEGDSALLQRSTTQLLEIASKNNIPISCLHLDYSSIKFEGDTIILHSGIPLPKLPTVGKIHIAANNAPTGNPKSLTESDILYMFHYGMKCLCVKELMFDKVQLPTSIRLEAFTDIMKTRNIQVRWRPFNIDFHLDLQNGHWEVDTQVLENIPCSTVSINKKHSVLQQRSTVQLLHVAHRHNILILSLLFNESFKTVDNETIILNNGIRLTNLPPLQKMHFVDENDRCAREITERDIDNILLCAMKDQHFNVLCFEGWLMPVSISHALTYRMISRALNVSWCPFDRVFRLNLQTGHWEVDNFEAIRDSYSQTFSINNIDTRLQQRSKVQLLYIAANHDIPISCVHLKKCVQHYREESFELHTGIHLHPMATVEHICIEIGMEEKKKLKKLTKPDLKKLFLYGMKCQKLKDISFRDCLLPLDNLSKYIPSDMKARDITITWSEFGYCLNLQTGDWEVGDRDTITALCSKTVEISDYDIQLLQRCTIRLLEKAAKYDIPISCLYLKESFSKIDAGDIILRSGLRLPCPASVKKVVIDTEDEEREMTETEVADILMFVQQSQLLEELEFKGWLMPVSFSPLSFTMIYRNIDVSWCPFDNVFHLDLQTGHWEVDNIDSLRQLLSHAININGLDKKKKQRSTIQLIHVASNHDIPISSLWLCRSFSKIDAGNIILRSSLHLSCPVSVKKVVIETEKGREMTETEVVDILKFVQKSHMLEELEFYYCLLPQSIPAESIPSMLKSGDMEVSWLILYNWLEFNLQSGRWMHSDTRQEITDTEYNDTVTWFQDEHR